MISRFDTNLDVLLIFAGLSPAVNTPLIVVALTALSANPADETNHPLRLLAMNISNYTPTEGDLALLFTPARGTFFAGLCCSLLAATGAVLAEQWLQNYGRTGRTGPVEALAIRRTEKLVGAENWGLRQVVEGIATLLLISLTLCFITLVDYLWTVNKPVALPVLVFAAARAFLHVAMIVVAAINATCPSQTGPSAALRWPCLAVQRFIYSVEGESPGSVPSRHTISAINSWIFGRSESNLTLRLVVGILAVFLECVGACMVIICLVIVAVLQVLIPPEREQTESSRPDPSTLPELDGGFSTSLRQPAHDH